MNMSEGAEYEDVKKDNAFTYSFCNALHVRVEWMSEGF